MPDYNDPHSPYAEPGPYDQDNPSPYAAQGNEGYADQYPTDQPQYPPEEYPAEGYDTNAMPPRADDVRRPAGPLVGKSQYEAMPASDFAAPTDLSQLAPPQMSTGFNDRKTAEVSLPSGRPAPEVAGDLGSMYPQETVSEGDQPRFELPVPVGEADEAHVFARKVFGGALLAEGGAFVALYAAGKLSSGLVPGIGSFLLGGLLIMGFPWSVMAVLGLRTAGFALMLVCGLFGAALANAIGSPVPTPGAIAIVASALGVGAAFLSLLGSPSHTRVFAGTGLYVVAALASALLGGIDTGSHKLAISETDPAWQPREIKDDTLGFSFTKEADWAMLPWEKLSTLALAAKIGAPPTVQFIDRSQSVLVLVHAMAPEGKATDGGLAIESDILAGDDPHWAQLSAGLPQDQRREYEWNGLAGEERVYEGTVDDPRAGRGTTRILVNRLEGGSATLFITAVSRATDDPDAPSATGGRDMVFRSLSLFSLNQGGDNP